MNITPDSPSKGYDTEADNPTLQKTPEKRPEDEQTSFKPSPASHPEIEDHQSSNTSEEDPWLERIALKGKGWRRLKLLLTAIGIVVSIVVRFFLPLDQVDCILDKTHIWLEPANTYLRTHSQFAFNIKFLFTLMIDIKVVAVIFHWVFISLKWQFAFDVVMFLAIRFVCTHLTFYRNATGIYWPESSFMSLSNAGLSDQQYQVSGYTGCLTLITLYWMNQSKKKLAIVSTVCLVFSILIELSFRISYSTDIFAAIVIANVCNFLSEAWAKPYDEKINDFLRVSWEQMSGREEKRGPL